MSTTTSSSSTTTTTSTTTSSTTSTSTSTSTTSSTTTSTSSTTSTSTTTSTSSSTSTTTSTTTTALFPSGEVWFNYSTGETLYFCRFDRNGRVFLSDGSAKAWWGGSGGDADSYDVPMTEVLQAAGESRHYVGVFDADGNITTEGVYRVTIYLQAGANPADADTPIAQGELYWDGSAEVTLYTLDNDVDATYDIVAGLEETQDTVKNVYNQDEETSDGVYPRRTLRRSRRSRL